MLEASFGSVEFNMDGTVPSSSIGARMTSYRIPDVSIASDALVMMDKKMLTTKSSRNENNRVLQSAAAVTKLSPGHLGVPLSEYEHHLCCAGDNRQHLRRWRDGVVTAI